MLVAELRNKISRGKPSVRLSPLKDLSFTDDGLKIGENEPVWLDDLAVDKLAKFLDVPTSYAKKIPSHLRQYTLNYLLTSASEGVDVNLHWMGENLTGIFPADKRVVPVNDMAARLSTVFAPEDEVVRFISDDQHFHMDVLVQNLSVNVPARNKAWRPDSDDITHGGIRLVGSTNPAVLPVLQTYMHRLVCSNGLAVEEPDRQVTLRGNTVEEVLAELEENARLLLAGLPDRLEQYRLSDEIEIETNVEQTIRQLAQERNIADRVTMKVIEAAAELPPVGLTQFDLLNLFNSLANRDGISYSSQLKLQNLSGEMAVDHGLIEHRCNSCSRPI